MAKERQLWYNTSQKMKDSADDKLTRFELRLKKAMNPRCRKYKRHRTKKPVDDQAPRRTKLQAVLEEIRSGDLAAPRYDPRLYGGSAVVKAGMGGVESMVKAAVFITGAAVADAVDSAKEAIEARKARREEEKDRIRRELNLVLRRKYYAQEAERRHKEAERLRAAVPPPLNPMPTREALIHAYVHRHVSEEAGIRFGNLVIDLEEHVRRTVQHDGARIVGNAGGVRDWLKKHCPELAPHYHTCQRFKRKAQPDL